MKEYLVTWQIDITADSPEEAAREAKKYQLTGKWCSVFDVCSEEGETTRVDLDELGQEQQ